MSDKPLTAKEYRYLLRNDPDAPPCLGCSDEQVDLCAVPETAKRWASHDIGCHTFHMYLRKKWTTERKEKKNGDIPMG